MAAITGIYNHYIATTTITFETEQLSVPTMTERIRAIATDNPCYVYESDGNVLGYCYAHPWKGKAAYNNTCETTVYLAPGNEHKGIGTQLMNKLIEDCRQRGVHVLIACITGGNEASNVMHEKLGFKRVSDFKEVGRKFGKWLDVVDYELILE